MAVVGKKLVRSKSGLKIVAASDEFASPFLLCEPVWVPDNQSLQCTQCNMKFDFMKRRHHCRRCGQCFCNTCCDNKLPLPRMCFVDPVRLCASCAEIAYKENEFFDRHIKTLTNGACFNVSGLPDIDSSDSWMCRLSSDHRWLRFENDTNSNVDDIDLIQIESAQIRTSGTDAQGNVVASGMSIHYLNRCGEYQDISISAANSANRKQCIMWIVAMQKALKLIFESRGQRSPPVVSSERSLN